MNKKFYRELGSISESDFNKRSEEEKRILTEDSHKKNKRRYHHINVNESIVEIFFLFETLFIVALIFYNQ